MSVNDPIGDMIARIRNAQMRAKSKVSMPSSKQRERVAEVLKTEGFIRGYASVAHANGRNELEIELKYFDGAPVISSFSSKPLVTPVIRFETSVREVPHSERARLVSCRGSTLTAFLSIETVTSSCTTSCRAPFGPFTLTVWPSTLAVTPDGTAIGRFPMRDI